MNLDVIYVTYNPNLNFLEQSINSIVRNVRKVYVVDNTPGKAKYLENYASDKIEVVYLNANMGIAYAQNVGIKKSIKNGSDYVLLSDQDTIYPEDYLFDMLKSFELSENAIACVPLFRDINQKKANEGFIRKYPFGFKKFYPAKGKYEVFQAIASGKIISMKLLKKVGFMNEDLFIDWVDLEWCWRAHKKGYKIIGNADVTITHQLGDNAKDIGFREVNLRSPFRHYYITRNAFYLSLQSPDLDLLHRAILFLKSIRYIIGFPLLSKPHLTHLRYVLLGFFHGIIGKLGELK
ncbi:glycosyl transferase family 2 [Chloroherpeton thalassium ATCC 35110]|uniref:Glycosyl transferase family 2 n=1 Tax=Chloroherpeton thalassium (strain ATCC 35110 / GB-78) TaxID=517418 RepID=B3QVC3_CHLT3|nr:glycosyltransferase family 2 protein [Chloroherpeton thalassium]ACF14523.1 glycosyl transferase family 2 [Chloroherpeton thalassium ATCC 35110]